MVNEIDPLAQMAEHMTFNHGVRSSTLRWVTKVKEELHEVRFLFCFARFQARVELCEPQVRQERAVGTIKGDSRIKTRV